MRSVIIYYSRAGATKSVAEKIRDAFHADMIFVEPEKAYGNYLSAVIRNGTEKMTKNAAKVKTPVKDVSEYDVVFIGFPVWYGTMPTFMQEYVKKCNIHGKKVIPFATAASNGKESSLKTVKEIFADCEVSDYFYTTKPKNGEADAWVKGLVQKLK